MVESLLVWKMIGNLEDLDSDGTRVKQVRIRVSDRRGDQLLVVDTLECIGTGSFGSVYSARVEGYPTIAMKITTGKPSRLQQELDVLSKVCTKGHLSLPRFEFGALNANRDLLVIGMELCVPNTLYDLLLCTRLSNLSDMLFLGYQVTQAVSCVHAEGCIHRDIKLQNFVFDTSGNVKLIDFGLASTSVHPPPGDAVAGTVSFMSPEMAHNVLHRDTRVSVGISADMWSLGIVLFSIFTQRNPYPVSVSSTESESPSQSRQPPTHSHADSQDRDEEHHGKTPTQPPCSNSGSGGGGDHHSSSVDPSALSARSHRGDSAGAEGRRPSQPPHHSIQNISHAASNAGNAGSSNNNNSSSGDGGNGNSATTQTQAELLLRVEAGDWRWPEEEFTHNSEDRIPIAIRQLIESLLSKNPSDRPSIKTVLSNSVWDDRRRSPPTVVTSFLGAQDDMLASQDESFLMRAVAKVVTSSPVASSTLTGVQGPGNHGGTLLLEGAGSGAGATAFSREGEEQEDQIGEGQGHCQGQGPSGGRDGNGGEASTTPLHDTSRSVVGQSLEGRSSLKVVTKPKVELDSCYPVTDIYDLRGADPKQKPSRSKKAAAAAGATTAKTIKELAEVIREVSRSVPRAAPGVLTDSSSQEARVGLAIEKTEQDSIPLGEDFSSTVKPETEDATIPQSAAAKEASSPSVLVTPSPLSSAAPTKGASSPTSQLPSSEGNNSATTTSGSTTRVETAAASAVVVQPKKRLGLTPFRSSPSLSAFQAPQKIAPNGSLSQLPTSTSPSPSHSAARGRIAHPTASQPSAQKRARDDGLSLNASREKTDRRYTGERRRATTVLSDEEEDASEEEGDKENSIDSEEADEEEPNNVRRNKADVKRGVCVGGSASALVHPAPAEDVVKGRASLDRSSKPLPKNTTMATNGTSGNKHASPHPSPGLCAPPSLASSSPSPPPLAEDGVSPASASASAVAAAAPGSSSRSVTTRRAVHPDFVYRFREIAREEKAARAFMADTLLQFLEWNCSRLLLLVQEDQDRCHLSWMASAQRETAAHAHRFGQVSRCPIGKYRDGFLCDGCDFEFLPVSRKSKMLFYHCSCGRDLCLECFSAYEVKCTCFKCQKVLRNTQEARAHTRSCVAMGFTQSTRVTRGGHPHPPHGSEGVSRIGGKRSRSLTEMNTATSVPASSSEASTEKSRGRRAATMTTTTTTDGVGERVRPASSSAKGPKVPRVGAAGNAARRRILQSDDDESTSEDVSDDSLGMPPTRRTTATTTTTRTSRSTNRNGRKALLGAMDATPIDDGDEEKVGQSDQSDQEKDDKQEDSKKIHSSSSREQKQQQHQPPPYKQQRRRRVEDSEGQREGLATTDPPPHAAKKTATTKGALVVDPEQPWKPFERLRQQQLEHQQHHGLVMPTAEERESYLHGAWLQTYYVFPNDGDDDDAQPDALAYQIQTGRIAAIFFSSVFPLHSAILSMLERVFFVVDDVDPTESVDRTTTYSLMQAKADPHLEETLQLMQEIAAYDTNMRKQHRCPGTPSIYPSPRSNYTPEGEPFVYVRWFRRNHDRSIWVFLLSHGGMQAFINNGEYELRWVDSERVFRVRNNGVCDVISHENPVFAQVEQLMYEDQPGE